MIDFILGDIVALGDDYAVIQAGHIGYRVYIPSRLLAGLKKNTQYKLLTHHHIREDSQELFGFLETSDKDMFQLLITVSGVGPKVALKALGLLDARGILDAISMESVSHLTQIPGIGKKGAERIIIELKDKCGSIDSEHSAAISSSTGNRALEGDILEALKQLGYENSEVRVALKNSASQRESCQSVEDNLKVLLKHL